MTDPFTDPPEFQRFKQAARQEYEAWKQTQPKRLTDPSAPRPRFTVEIHAVSGCFERVRGRLAGQASPDVSGTDRH